MFLTAVGRVLSALVVCVGFGYGSREFLVPSNDDFIQLSSAFDAAAAAAAADRQEAAAGERSYAGTAAAGLVGLYHTAVCFRTAPSRLSRAHMFRVSANRGHRRPQIDSANGCPSWSGVRPPDSVGHNDPISGEMVSLSGIFMGT